MKLLGRLMCIASRGLSEESFKALTPTQQIKYIKEHPQSKYGKDPKWLKRAKMLKTKALNTKNVKNAKVKSKPISGADRAKKVFSNIRKQALTKRKITEALKKGTYKIKFKKLDGTTRIMYGSLSPEYVADYMFKGSKSGKPIKSNPNVVKVVDTKLDPPAFRSFRLENLISFEKVK